jgi:hypothetical protein
LSLFFSNGQVIELKLWSQDLRVAVRQRLSSRQPSTTSLSYWYLANGRRILASDNAVSRKSMISFTKLREKKTGPFLNAKEGN